MTQEINVSGTKNLIYLCQQAKIEKFIYMSSCSVYGDSGNTYASEETRTNPLTEYAKAKVLNENYLLDNDFEFEVKILRNATAFGYSANIRTDLVINDLTVSAIENNHIRVLSDGVQEGHLFILAILVDLLITLLIMMTEKNSWLTLELKV